MTQRKPGDPLLATHLTMPAVWWYARVSLSTSASSFPDGGSLLEVWESSNSVDCPLDDLRAALDGSSGAAIYLGFDMPEGFEVLSLNRLSELGAVTTYRRFETGHAAVVDLRLPPTGRFLVPGRRTADPDVRPPGCVAIHGAGRW